MFHCHTLYSVFFQVVLIFIETSHFIQCFCGLRNKNFYPIFWELLQHEIHIRRKFSHLYCGLRSSVPKFRQASDVNAKVSLSYSVHEVVFNFVPNFLWTGNMKEKFQVIQWLFRLPGNLQLFSNLTVKSWYSQKRLTLYSDSVLLVVAYKVYQFVCKR